MIRTGNLRRSAALGHLSAGFEHGDFKRVVIVARKNFVKPVRALQFEPAQRLNAPKLGNGISLELHCGFNYISSSMLAQLDEASRLSRATPRPS